jgi:hypothetical protein
MHFQIYTVSINLHCVQKELLNLTLHYHKCRLQLWVYNISGNLIRITSLMRNAQHLNKKQTSVIIFTHARIYIINS